MSEQGIRDIGPEFGPELEDRLSKKFKTEETPTDDIDYGTLIVQFSQLTGEDDQTKILATLDRFDWNLEASVQNFFDTLDGNTYYHNSSSNAATASPNHTTDELTDDVYDADNETKDSDQFGKNEDKFQNEDDVINNMCSNDDINNNYDDNNNNNNHDNKDNSSNNNNNNDNNNNNNDNNNNDNNNNKDNNNNDAKNKNNKNNNNNYAYVYYDYESEDYGDYDAGSHNPAPRSSSSSSTRTTSNPFIFGKHSSNYNSEHAKIDRNYHNTTTTTTSTTAASTLNYDYNNNNNNNNNNVNSYDNNNNNITTTTNFDNNNNNNNNNNNIDNNVVCTELEISKFYCRLAAPGLTGWTCEIPKRNVNVSLKMLCVAKLANTYVSYEKLIYLLELCERLDVYAFKELVYKTAARNFFTIRNMPPFLKLSPHIPELVRNYVANE